MIFNKIFTATFVSEILLFVRIVDVREDGGLKGLILLALIKFELKFRGSRDNLLDSVTILEGRSEVENSFLDAITVGYLLHFRGKGQLASLKVESHTG